MTNTWAEFLSNPFVYVVAISVVGTVWIAAGFPEFWKLEFWKNKVK